ncbi:MAG: hypothetical protein ACOX6P_00445 [Candidatus Merdivicinus sp.]
MKKRAKTVGKFRPNSLVSSLSHPHPSDTDPLGSWTGIPESPDDMPIQDADDL